MFPFTFKIMRIRMSPYQNPTVMSLTAETANFRTIKQARGLTAGVELIPAVITD